MSDPSRPTHYAVVAYVRNSVGHFVEDLRRELYPAHGHLPAHVTVLPPRPLRGTEAEAKALLQQRLEKVETFQIQMGNVETFIPTTPTVFLRVAKHAHRFRELHEDLNVGPFHCAEQWPYMPHLTIVKMPGIEEAEEALASSRERWDRYAGLRTAQVVDFTFVRESTEQHWTDLATFPLQPRK
ncbi:MAG TPA: 2'-5' RNA ligase family protein [Terriglobales bacterium]|nr:2'-5' RNA ligase family protein [Terriglobales bacterium]